VSFLLENWLLIAIAFVSGALLVWPLIRARAGGPSLGTLAATQMINGKHAQVVDVRDAAEFGKGSLPNARNIPAANLADRSRELKKDKPVLLVCANGSAAGKAAAQLRAAGFAEVYTLAGGLASWREAGLPLTSKAG
jgi:rhodanese-related sulfurtransferase